MCVFRSPIRLLLAIVMTTFSLTLLGWSLWPPGHTLRRQVIRPSQMQLPTPSAGQQAPLTVPETRLLSLDYAPTVRAGESERVHLSIETDGAPQSALPSVYDHYHVLAEARLEMNSVETRPHDAVSEPLLPGQSVSFFWNLYPGEAGHFSGTLWVYLHFIPKNGGLESRQTISAQEIEIDSTTLFGLRSETASNLGLASVFITALLDFPVLIDLFKWIKKRPEKS